MAATPATSLTLISSGIQDSRLRPPLGNPNTDQFVKVLRKTTRWAAQWRRVDFDGNPEFGQKVSLTIPRIAELVNGLMLVVQMPDIATVQAAAQAAATAAGRQFLGPYFGWTNSLGHALIQQVELEIGGAIVETLDGRLMEILDDLYEPIETLKAKNAMIARAPSGFTSTTWVGTPSSPVTVYIPIPFWFSRPGIQSHALPIDALSADKVRIHVTFRPVTQVYYTDARFDSRTVGIQADNYGRGATEPMLGIAECPFWQSTTAAGAGKAYSLTAATPTAGQAAELIAGYKMPVRLGLGSAHFMIEYISLEEPETIGFRRSELTYFVEQHTAIPVQQTRGVAEVRAPLPFRNPTKELLWVFQRQEAASYNAWFLFSRDLAAYKPTWQGPTNPCLIPWWPDAVLTPLATNKWRVLPAFRDGESDPMLGAALYYDSYERFIHQGPSLFRSVLPTLHAIKAPVHNRYIYMWPFGFNERAAYEPEGAANWDKLPRKEAYFTMNRLRNCGDRPDLNLYAWTTTWNVLKIYGGRGGMLFTN